MNPKLIITLGSGGLGRPLAGRDHYSGFIYYNVDDSLPTGFGTDRIKQIASLKEIEDLGVVEGDADWDTLHYHVSEFFRIQSQGILWVSIADGAVGTIPDFDAHDYAEIVALQDFAEGQIRQIGVHQVVTPFDVAQVTLIDVQAKQLRAEGRPLSVIYGSDFLGVTDLSTLADLRALDDELVSVSIGEDGESRGAAIAVATSVSTNVTGALLGAVSFASVNESIAWVEKFNISNGAELESAAFANGDLTKTKSVAFLDALHSKGYIFLRKFTQYNKSGTYFNDNQTAVSETSDFAFINDNRVIDKASRQIVFFVLPKLSSPLQVNTDGSLFEDTVAVFDNLTRQALEQMLRDQEISAFDVIIDPTQNVLSTSKLFASIKIVPVGVARTIEFEVGYALSV